MTRPSRQRVWPEPVALALGGVLWTLGFLTTMWLLLPGLVAYVFAFRHQTRRHNMLLDALQSGPSEASDG